MASYLDLYVGAGGLSYHVSCKVNQCRSQIAACIMTGLLGSAPLLGGPKIYVSFVLFFQSFVNVPSRTIAGVWIDLVFLVVAVTIAVVVAVVVVVVVAVVVVAIVVVVAVVVVVIVCSPFVGGITTTTAATTSTAATVRLGIKT